MSDNIRQPHHVDRKPQWEAIARQHLGDVANIPLVDRLLYWIDENDLGAALEEVGLVKGGTGQFVTLEQMAAEFLDHIKKARDA